MVTLNFVSYGTLCIRDVPINGAGVRKSNESPKQRISVEWTVIDENQLFIIIFLHIFFQNCVGNNTVQIQMVALNRRKNCHIHETFWGMALHQQTEKEQHIITFIFVVHFYVRIICFPFCPLLLLFRHQQHFVLPISPTSSICT